MKNSPWVAWVALFSSRLWCAHVTVTPEASKMAVFSSGKFGLHSVDENFICRHVSLESAFCEYQAVIRRAFIRTSEDGGDTEHNFL